MNRITYSNNRITKNKNRMPLHPFIKLGPYKFSLQASVDHHGYSYEQWSLHSLSRCGKHFSVTIIKLLNVISRIPIINLLPIYFCTNSWNVRAVICPEGRLSSLALSSVYSPTVEDASWSTLMVQAHVCPFTAGRGVGTETWDRQCVSSWRPLVWLGHLW